LNADALKNKLDISVIRVVTMLLNGTTGMDDDRPGGLNDAIADASFLA
jgi:hypothetical protein